MIGARKRHALLLVLFGAYFCCYLDRMVMASAIPFIARDLHLSLTAMGAVLSVFFAGYALMQIPGGLLADRFGSKRVLTLSIAWFSCLTALTGMAQSLRSLLLVRGLFGAGEGPFPAALSKAVASWTPVTEVGRSNGLLLTATFLGATVAPLLTSVLVTTWGWRSLFYMLSVPGLVSSILVWRSASEVSESLALRGTSMRAHLLDCLRTPAILWCAGTFFVSNAVSWGLMNWLPTYLLNVRGFGALKMGLLASATNLAGGSGLVVGGYVCDKWFRHRLRVPVVLGFFSSAIFTYLAAIAPNGEWAVAALAMVLFTSSVAFTAILTLPLVIVPSQSVGAAMGIVNTAGQLAGVIAPVAVGRVLELTSNNFTVVLYGMMAIGLLAIWPASRISQNGANRAVANGHESSTC